MSIRKHTKTVAGFSLIEAMIATTVMSVGLLAVATATTSTQLLRKRALDEETVFHGMTSRLEQARGDLFSATDFQTDVAADVAAAGEFERDYVLDNDLDGKQDVPRTPGDPNAPVLHLRVTAPDPPSDPNSLLQVEVTATWYGVSGTRTRTLTALVANRTGFGG